jgi:hypothetical protein
MEATSYGIIIGALCALGILSIAISVAVTYSISASVPLNHQDEWNDGEARCFEEQSVEG